MCNNKIDGISPEIFVELQIAKNSPHDLCAPIQTVSIKQESI